MGTRSLYEQLCRYGKSDYYPYHMPGHKRNPLGKLPAELLDIDITEIEGFDNLHHPKGILLDLQEKASALYGAEETFCLINGSTCGILSAVSAALPKGGHLLMSRDSHKSVYHGAYLRELRLSYLYPERAENFAFYEAVTPGQVEEVLERESDIGAVLIVSPTYEGRIADVRAIAEIVHRRGIPLIVDEAHGAHLGFAEGFAPGSCTQGADLVIHSVHKTLPAMTQTALLHVNGQLTDRERLRRFLHIYQSSSPSYVLMASVEDALEIAMRQGEKRFSYFRERYKTLLEKLQDCRHLCFVPWSDVESCRQDIGKLVISAVEGCVSGQWIYRELLERYHLQCEMAAGSYCLAMFTMADEEEAYQRMTDALLELDERIGLLSGEQPIRPDGKEGPREAVFEWQCPVLAQDTDIAIPLAEAWDMPWEMTGLSDAIGRPVADFINLYPPGSPLLAPGEILTRKLYEEIQGYLKQGLEIQGIINKK